MPRVLKVIRLLEPEMCETCRFNQGSVQVDQANGERVRVGVRCTRLDCDNWDFSDAERVDAIFPDREAA